MVVNDDVYIKTLRYQTIWSIKWAFLSHTCFMVYQEHLNYVSEISQEEIFILDPELVVMTSVGTSPSVMPDLVNPASSLEQSR